MEENNNQQQGQYQQYQAPQQPQGAPQGNQFFQGFNAPNTEEGLKKKFADLKTIFLVLGILASIAVVIDLVTVIPTIATLSSPLASYALAFSGKSAGGYIALLIVFYLFLSSALEELFFLYLFSFDPYNIESQYILY